MLETLPSWPSLTLAQSEKRFDEVLGLHWDPHQGGVLHVRIPGQDVALQLDRVPVEEWRHPSADQHVGDHPQAPHVWLVASIPTLDNLPGNGGRVVICWHITMKQSRYAPQGRWTQGCRMWWWECPHCPPDLWPDQNLLFWHWDPARPSLQIGCCLASSLQDWFSE